jgi:3'(2'), 5'-bisphosphate nucleotidase
VSFSAAELAAWLPEVLRIADAAGREIMRIYDAGFNVTFKSDRSPLTEADLAAQQVIGAALAALTPQIAMLGEESSPEVFEQRRQWPALWLVDPLDGTREFVKRNGEFTVNIALVEGHETVLGVVYAPARSVAYAAARGSGAFRRNADGSHTRIQVTAAPPAAVRVLASRSHGDAVADRMLERLGPQQRISIGSALKFGLLAEGSADLYLRRGPTSEWDTAAGQAIVQEAGGCVVDLSGRPLRYNARDSVVNPSFIAYADRSRDWAVLLATGAATAQPSSGQGA